MAVDSAPREAMQDDGRPEEVESERADQLPALLAYIKRSRGFDFSGYKRPSLQRRFHRRLDQLGLQDYNAYMDYLEVHPDEFTQLFNTVLINVTSFFRDPSAWDYLAGEIIPRLVNSREPDEQIRVWCAGTSSGEEAYTVAMLLAEALGEDGLRARVKIYATDVDEEALAHARQAAYAEREVTCVPPHLLTRYFELARPFYVFRKDLRRSVIFGRHDLVQDAPISRIDLLICRNTLMYFNSEMQTRILARFHFALLDDGYLFLGRAEMLFAQANLFVPTDLRWRVFSKVLRGTIPKQLWMAQIPGG